MSHLAINASILCTGTLLNTQVYSETFKCLFYVVLSKYINVPTEVFLRVVQHAIHNKLQAVGDEFSCESHKYHCQLFLQLKQDWQAEILFFQLPGRKIQIKHYEKYLGEWRTIMSCLKMLRKYLHLKALEKSQAVASQELCNQTGFFPRVRGQSR